MAYSKIKIIILLVLLPFLSKGQEVFTTHLGWTDLTLWYKLNDNLKVGGDMGYRTTFDNFEYHLAYVRPTIRWQPNPLYNLTFAISDFHTLIEGIDLNEVRLAQEAMLFWPKVGGFKFDHRLRFEERFFYINDIKENQYRTRYRLALHPPNFTLFGKDTSPFYSAVTFEAFLNLNNSEYNDLIGNSHRMELVLGNKITKKLKIGLHYIWQTGRIKNDVFDLKSNILRLRIGYKLN
ncbi:MAG: DUF2490 domain-containing protein [Reichenbachiella sp.]